MSFVPAPRTFRPVIACLALGLVLSACAGSTPTSQPTPAAPTSAPSTLSPTSTPVASPAIGVEVTVITGGAVGAHLADGAGHTLYTFDNDKPGVSNCTGGCLAEWPALSVPAGQTASAAPGVDGAIGTIRRSDGTSQVTYKGLPLYTFVSDAAPGDATGDGVDAFSIARA